MTQYLQTNIGIDKETTVRGALLGHADPETRMVLELRNTGCGGLQLYGTPAEMQELVTAMQQEVAAVQDQVATPAPVPWDLQNNAALGKDYADSQRKIRDNPQA